MWNIIILPFINDKIKTTTTYYVDYERYFVTKFTYIYIYTVVKHIFIFNIYHLVLQSHNYTQFSNSWISPGRHIIFLVPLDFGTIY
jgi:hypothetical protein